MNKVKIADATLCREDRSFSFKEKLEIIRQLDRMSCDIIELPEISNPKSDILMVRTASSFVKNSTLSVTAGSSVESIENAASALSSAKSARIKITLPTSSVGMEYFMMKKPAAMLEWIDKAVKLARSYTDEVEFCAVDATRAESSFLEEAVRTAVSAGAAYVSVCDSAAEMLPDAFAKFAQGVAETAGVPVGASCSDKNGLAVASLAMAACGGVSFVRCAVDGEIAQTEMLATLIKNCGEKFGISSEITYTELHRIAEQVRRIAGDSGSERVKSFAPQDESGAISLDASDTIEAVAAAVARLGYDLSDEDCARVHEELGRVGEKKRVGAAELDAIVASVALQVPDSYKLVSYVVNNGNIINSSAQITLERDGRTLVGVSLGDGPIDAAFRAIGQVTGSSYELDDFMIRSVTEGQEAIGNAVVKLRFEGRLYSGNGVSTDIVGASIRAYINAVNKIAYEEHNA